jgi:hypothetical protein
LFPTGLVIAYVGAVFAALCLAAINPPSLPLVRIDAQAGVTPPLHEDVGQDVRVVGCRLELLARIQQGGPLCSP